MQTTNYSKTPLLQGLKRSTLGAIIGEETVGKSFLALQLAISLTSGKDFLKLQTQPSVVLYLSGEDDSEIVQARQNSIQKHFKLTAGEIEKIKANFSAEFRFDFDLSLTENQEEFLKLTQGKDLVILDTLSRFHNLDENDSKQMKTLLNFFEKVCRENNTTILFLHHVSKLSSREGSGHKTYAMRGSSVLSTNLRFIINLVKKNRNQVELNFSKSSYTEDLKSIMLSRKTEGVLEGIGNEKRTIGEIIVPIDADVAKWNIFKPVIKQNARPSVATIKKNIISEGVEIQIRPGLRITAFKTPSVFDQSVLLALMRIAQIGRNKNLINGEAHFTTSQYQIFQIMGLNFERYDNLGEALATLAAVNYEFYDIETNRITRQGNLLKYALIKKEEKNKNVDSVTVTLDSLLSGVLKEKPEQYVQINLTERNLLKTGLAKLIHNWLSATIKTEGSQQIGISTLSEKLYGQPSEHHSTNSKRRKYITAAIEEISQLEHWEIKTLGEGKETLFKIKHLP